MIKWHCFSTSKVYFSSWFFFCFLPIGLQVSWVTLLILCSALKIMFAYETRSPMGRKQSKKLRWEGDFRSWKATSFYHICLKWKNESIVAQYITVQYSTVQHSTVQYITIKYITLQYSAAQHITEEYSTLWNKFHTSLVSLLDRLLQLVKLTS